uniref:RRM domain-containing protein n=1 Tax=Lepeophtheirus salmonis TaxID=72036 RepID=A0A0K2V405_LEPSM
MSACSIFDRITMINMNPDIMPKTLPLIPNSNGNGSDPLDTGGGGGNGTNNAGINNTNSSLVTSGSNGTTLEKDYYGCYCLKFIVKNGTHIPEEKVLQDFGQYGDVVDVRGPGLFSGLRGNHVYVRFIDKADALAASKHLSSKYYLLTPASISDVLPDNYGLYTISFYNKTGIPSSEVRKEFSNYGEVKNLTGSLDVKGGRVFVSYKEKTSAVQALQAFFFCKDRYPNMKFALPRCEKDYFGCYCLKFYNKSGDVTEEKVLKDFGQFGDVVDVRGPGLFDVTGDDVYVRYKDKSSAEQALVELVGKYDSLCLAPPSDIQADKLGFFTITFVNDKCLSKTDVWYIFSEFGSVAGVNGTFDCKKGRVFVSYKDKQGALNALETMLITKEYHLQVSKNSTVRKNDCNMIVRDEDSATGGIFNDIPGQMGSSLQSKPYLMSKDRHATPPRDHSRGRNELMSQQQQQQQQQPSSQQQKHQQQLIPAIPSVNNPQNQSSSSSLSQQQQNSDFLPSSSTAAFDSKQIMQQQQNKGGSKRSNGTVKYNRNIEKDIFGYYCLSFLNEDGDISEKKVRHDFGKFGEVVSVRGALGKQKGHVFVRFLRKESAENCLNCLNSFPLSEMSELFGKYLFLSPATPRDIDCDMYGLYSISFLNLNAKPYREIRAEFSKFGEVLRLTSGGGGNTEELVSISYANKSSAVKALQTHFTNKEFPYLDIAKGSSLLLVNSSDSSDNEDDPDSTRKKDPFHDPNISKNVQADVVDELLKPFQSYFSIYRTGQYSHPLGGFSNNHHTQTPVENHPQSQSVTSHSPQQQPPQQQQQPPPQQQQHHHHHHHQQQQQQQQQQQKQQKNHRILTSPSTNTPHPVNHIHHHHHHQQQQTNSNSTMTSTGAQRSPDKKYRIKKSKNDASNKNGFQSEKLEESSTTNGWSNHNAHSETTTITGRPIESRDMFGYYSLSFSTSSSTHSKETLRDDKKIRADFGSKVDRIRHTANESVVVSFSDLETASSCLNSPPLKSKYPDLRPVGNFHIVPDRSGFYSIDFINSGMNGIREITNEFSKHGEVMKVQQSGAKNSVKRFTMSYSEEKSAISAVKAYENSKDFLTVDFSRECLIEEDNQVHHQGA